MAEVLSNQRPPYTVRGGVFDVLKESQGDMLAADNLETRRAMEIFQESENVDIDPAAGVALATLINAIRAGQIERNAIVLLHITGGGRHKRHSEERLLAVEPDLQVEESEILAERTVEKMLRLFQ